MTPDGIAKLKRLANGGGPCAARAARILEREKDVVGYAQRTTGKTFCLDCGPRQWWDYLLLRGDRWDFDLFCVDCDADIHV